MAYFKRSGTLGRFFYPQVFDKFSQVCIWFHVQPDMQKESPHTLFQRKKRGTRPAMVQNLRPMHSLTLRPSAAAALRILSATSAGREMCRWASSPSETSPNSAW